MRTPTLERVDAWAYQRSDHWPERNPKAMALLGGVVYNILPVALGIHSLPGFPGIPTLYTQLVGLMVAVGGIGCLLGLLWPNRDFGLGIELAGCIVLTVGMFGYSFVNGLVPSQHNLAIAIGIGSLLRCGQIGLYVRGRKLRADGNHDRHRR